jgi:hypothetical protein
MSTEIIITLGVLAGTLQVIGYLLYITDEKIDPNPVTWFMFAYGTGILALLEWDSDATWPELFLPIACAVFAIYVSFRCWRKARVLDPSRWWPKDWSPEDKWERWSFISDITITVGYVLAWALATWAILTPEYREFAVLAFLFLSNVSTFPSFYPLLRETYLYPHKENWKPWATWSLAYTVLGIVTYASHIEIWYSLMFYPVANAFLHGLTGWLARPSRQRKVQVL